MSIFSCGTVYGRVNPSKLGQKSLLRTWKVAVGLYIEQVWMDYLPWYSKNRRIGFCIYFNDNVKGIPKNRRKHTLL